MRTSIFLTKSHAGKWTLAGTPDDLLTETKSKFRSLRADKSHPEIALAIYQESDGTREVIRLLTPEQKAKHEKQVAADTAAASDFDAKQAKTDGKTPEEKATEAEFKAKAEAAAKEESKNKK